MEEKLAEIFRALWSTIPGETEFWAAITGAVVGGLIAYMVQMKALREGRKQRDEDHKRLQQSLANALLVKMVRIYSNFYNFHQHFEDSFARAVRDEFDGEPWQIVRPLANPPDSVHFSSEEMGMVLALKDDDVFNLVLPMDVIHNSFIDALKVLNTERTVLTERLKADEVEGILISSALDKNQMAALRPRMVGVNDLIEQLRPLAKRNFEESEAALKGLQKVFQGNLGLDHKLVFKMKPNDTATA